MQAHQLQVQRIDALNEGMTAVSQHANAATAQARPTTLAAASWLKRNTSRETYAQLEGDLAKLKVIERKLARAARHENIEQQVSSALRQDRLAPKGRAIPALGSASEWLSAVHRLTEAGQVVGCVRVLELLIQVLALPASTYVEIAAGGPQSGDAYWDDIAAGGDAAGGDEEGGGGGIEERGTSDVGEQQQEDMGFPVWVESAAMFLREHRMWRASRLTHVHLKPRSSLPRTIQVRTLLLLYLLHLLYLLYSLYLLYLLYLLC